MVPVSSGHDQVTGVCTPQGGFVYYISHSGINIIHTSVCPQYRGVQGIYIIIRTSVCPQYRGGQLSGCWWFTLLLCFDTTIY